MAVHSVIPNENVLVADIGSTLNANGGNVNINHSPEFFTAAAKINPWSKHKPVVRDDLFCQDYDSTKPNYVNDWWKGGDNNCGFGKIPVITDYKNIPANMDGGMNGWEYVLPTNKLRLGDFCGYYPGAKPFVSDFRVQDQIPNTSGSYVRGSCAINAAGTSTQLSLVEFPNFQSCYFAMYIKKNSGTGAYRATASNPLSSGDGAFEVSISANGLNEGKWTAYPFLSSIKIEPFDADRAASYYTLPNLNPIEFEIISEAASMAVNIRCHYNYSGTTRVSITIESITITSNVGSMTLKDNFLRVRFANKKINDVMVAGETKIDLGDISVVNGKAVSVSLRPAQTLIMLTEDVDYVIYVSLSSAKYISKHGIGDDVVLPIE